MASQFILLGPFFCFYLFMLASESLVTNSSTGENNHSSVPEAPPISSENKGLRLPTVTSTSSILPTIWNDTEIIKPENTPPWEYHLKYENLITPGRSVSQILEIVFRKYDRRIRPFYGVKQLNVDLDMLILSFGEISETSMDFQVDLYLGQFWQDPRLAYGINRTIILGGEAAEKFWLPDTFFVNSINTRVHKMVFANKKIWINLINGTMMLSARLLTRNSCKLDLRNYPLDEQTCHLAFESFSYEDKDLNYKWRGKLASDITIYDNEMAQFDIVSAKRFLKHHVYHSDMFSGLTATIVFRRRSMYYIFQMYIPCVCVVALSWVSFWINHEAVPARVALSITTVLTISYMRGNVNAGMPRVSYLKSIDYFLLGAFVFIFMTLLEYVLILKQSRKWKPDDIKEHESGHGENEEDPAKKPLLVTVAFGGKSYRFKHSLEDIENGMKSHPTRKNLGRDRKRKQNLDLVDRLKPAFRNGLRRAPKHEGIVIKFLRQRFKRERGVHYLDHYSRVLFPLGYAGFLAVYFFIYMT